MIKSHRTIGTVILILVLAGFNGDGTLRTIMKEGKLPRLPKNAKTIRSEIVSNNTNRYGYLAFQASERELTRWVKKTGVKETSREELFLEDIIVWPRSRPGWFSQRLDSARNATLYYKQRQDDKFILIICNDKDRDRILLEYVIAQ